MPTPTGDRDDLDAHWMSRALTAATRGPAADPNPRVGCVVVSATGELLSTGWHRGAGTPHAEVNAITGAQGDLTGATAYVTLEPWNHTGRTPPCTDALLGAGIARVVQATDDPNASASGGAARLRRNGVTVRSGVLADAAHDLNHTWLHRNRTGRPWVIWKYASTLDGRSAARDGTSRWITGPEAHTDVHQRRSRCGAIVVGTGTALVDDPRLTVRDGSQDPGHPPLRVVMGRRRLPPTARVLDDAAPTLVHDGRDPTVLLAELAARGVHAVWLEGGPTLAAAFLRAGLVDEVISYLAPMLFGAGAPALSDLGIQSLSEAVRLQLTDVSRLGDDIRLISRPAPRHSSAAGEAANKPANKPADGPPNRSEPH